MSSSFIVDASAGHTRRAARTANRDLDLAVEARAPSMDRRKRSSLSSTLERSGGGRDEGRGPPAVDAPRDRRDDDDDGTATKAARCRREVVVARVAARPLSAEDDARSSAAIAARTPADGAIPERLWGANGQTTK
jgi:hypothetical protein